tara:strand:+ start:2174 stop:2329 length:156 start_codon:yes stop_codon:yes gene_type:complete
MKVQHLDPSHLKPFEKNPKKHTIKQIEKIIKSVEDTGKKATKIRESKVLIT